MKAIIRFSTVICLAGLLAGSWVSAQGLAVESEGGSPDEMRSESGYLEVAGGKIYYEQAGEGETMIFIHDGLLHHEVWDAQFLFFAARYRVIRYDRRGYGRSGQPEEAYSNLADLYQVLEQLHVDRAVLVGMSAGGRLAIDFALEYPHRVSMLVLVGAVVRGYGYSDHFYTRGGRLTVADYVDTEKMLKYWVGEDPYEIAPENEAAKARARDLITSNPRNVDTQKFQLAQPPARSALGNLAELSVPTLITVGEYDIPDVHAHAGAIEAGIEGAKRIVISNAAHLVPLEQPDDFNGHVSLFIKETAFFEILESQGTAAASDFITEAKRRNPDEVLFRESEINLMGYQALQAGDVDEAIALFNLNVMAFPLSWNVYDSLAEAYAQKGETALAIENFEKSLQLNRQNTNATGWLERLGER
jgi:pimeloyl-ACP methyl ester carboxylesterase